MLSLTSVDYKLMFVQILHVTSVLYTYCPRSESSIVFSIGAKFFFLCQLRLEILIYTVFHKKTPFFFPS